MAAAISNCINIRDIDGTIARSSSSPASSRNAGAIRARPSRNGVKKTGGDFVVTMCEASGIRKDGSSTTPSQTGSPMREQYSISSRAARLLPLSVIHSEAGLPGSWRKNVRKSNGQCFSQPIKINCSS